MLTIFLKNSIATFKLMDKFLLKNRNEQVFSRLPSQNYIQAEVPVLWGEKNDVSAVTVMLSVEARKNSVKNF